MRHPRLSRRTLLTGGGVGAAALLAGGIGVEQGVLPGRVPLQRWLGLNGTDGTVPDVEAGPVLSGSFTSDARLGATVRWHLLLPPGADAHRPDLPLVVGLHGLGWDIDDFLPDRLGLAEHLAASVDRGTPPFAVAVAEGGSGYWHERPSGEDAGRMITDELLPLLAGRGLAPAPDPTHRVGLIGWSMGGYGALRLGGLLGSDAVAVVAVAGPALWTDPDDASTDGFADAAEYEEYGEFSMFGHQDDLDGVAVSIDCGTGDPFYRAAEDYADGFASGSDKGADVRASFEPGAHDRGFWRRVMPGQLDFLGAHVGSRT